MGAQLAHPAALDRSGCAAGCFDFDEDYPSGLEADAVWNAGSSRADEFPAQAPVSLNRSLEGLFEWCSFMVVSSMGERVTTGDG